MGELALKTWIAAALLCSLPVLGLFAVEDAKTPDPKPAISDEEADKLLISLNSEDYQEREASTRKLFQFASYPVLCRLYSALEKTPDPEARGRMEELVPAMLKEMGDSIYISDFKFLGPIPFPMDETKVAANQPQQPYNLEWVRQITPIDELETLDLKAEYSLKSYMDGQQVDPSGVSTPDKAKTIKASWKRPCENQRGLVDFCKMYPEQMCWSSVFALTFVKAEKVTKAKLYIGSDDGVGVWVNGKCVEFQDSKRAVVKDQDKMTVELKEGWNPILIKVTNGWGMWGLSFRITQLNGMAWDDKKISPVCNGEAQPAVPGPKVPKEYIKPGDQDPGKQ